jgi:hypothetical protein
VLNPILKNLAGWLLGIFGVSLLLFGIWRIGMTYEPGPGPSSRIVELWDILYIQAGIVTAFFGLKSTNRQRRRKQ